MLASAQNTSAYASVRIHAKICGIWLAQLDVPKRSTVAQIVASSGAKEGYAPCGWMGRRGMEGCVRGRIVKGEEVVLGSVVRVVVQCSFMVWVMRESFEVAEWCGGGYFT